MKSLLRGVQTAQLTSFSINAQAGISIGWPSTLHVEPVLALRSSLHSLTEQLSIESHG